VIYRLFNYQIIALSGLNFFFVITLPRLPSPPLMYVRLLLLPLI
jgi:hypothetical protein